MPLFNRITRLFRADLHAVLDRIEEPESLLRQAVREMEEDLAADEQRQRLLCHQQEHGARQVGEIEQSLARIEQELDLCFGAGKDELARGLVRRKLEMLGKRARLQSRTEELARALAALRKRSTENRARLDGMRQKLELLAVRTEREVSADEVAPPDPLIGEDEVEIAYLQELNKRRSA